MKVIYVFDTDSENFDPLQLKIFQQSQEMAYTIREIRQQVRHWEKYDDRLAIPVEEIFDAIIDIINENTNIDYWSSKMLNNVINLNKV